MAQIPIRVMLVDDHAIVRSGFRRLLEQTADILVAAEAASGEEAYQAFPGCRPDVTVMDLSMPGGGGLVGVNRWITDCIGCTRVDEKVVSWQPHFLGGRDRKIKDKMTELERAIDAIEHGLLQVSRAEERPTKKIALSKRMKHYKVPGLSAAFVYQEELAWAKGFGVVEAGGEKPVTPETIFQAASISKSFTALIALHLVETGLLDLDADANDFLRSWKIPKSKYIQARSDGAHPKVTLRGLLSHSAGLGIHSYHGYPAGGELPTLLQILNGEPPANSKPVRVEQAPGKEYKYSSGGSMVVQQMIEDVTGRSLAVLAKEFIFNKLGMTNSTFESRLPQAYLPQAATGHDKNSEPVPGKWHTYPQQAAASLWTTPSDLARLIIEIIKSLKGESFEDAGQLSWSPRWGALKPTPAQ